MTETGMIVKATGGFYYVKTQQDEVECRGRGLLRKEGLTPHVGDKVEMQRNADGSGTVIDILPRKNDLIRPPLANLDYMVVVLSVTAPKPNPAITDKFLAVLEYKGIEPVLVITKTDLEDGADWLALYRKAGYRAFAVSASTGAGVEELTSFLAGKFCAFSGNSGVGKSSLLNAIDPALGLTVGDTSKKLGRGRHTTRHVELFPLPGGGLAADTPGFSSMDLMQMAQIYKEDLPGCFRDFAPFISGCRFRDCSHTKEEGCAVLAAVKQGEISASRHRSYLLLYQEVKDRKEWQEKE